VAASIVTFSAFEDDAQYEWTIGAETITQKSFSRTSFPGGAIIPVRLIVKKTPNKECFPDDDGCDTVIRYLYTLRYINETHTYNIDVISGKYKGHNNDNPFKDFTINIQSDYVKPGGDSVWDMKTKIDGLIGSCELYDWDLSKKTYKQYYFAMYYNYDCLNPKGLLTIFGKNNDSILIEYSIQKLPGSSHVKERIGKTFTGVRIYQ